MAERIFQIFAGLVLIVAGAGIVYAFHMHGRQRGGDISDGGFLLLTEAYSIVGSLLILLGLRYAFGKYSFIERGILRSLRHFAVVVLLLALAIAAAMIFCFR
jgi:hypothetical protein